MKRTSLVFLCLALVCIVFFSGQQRRPATTSPRTPQRQAATVRPQTPQRQSEPPSEPRTPIQYLFPEDIPWPASANPAAPRNVTIFGDPREPVLYVTRTLFPKGAKGVPHFHADPRTVVVISGTYYYGTGDEFDEKKLVAMPPGSFILEPPGEPHFTWAKDGDVIVQTTGVGPSSTEFPKKKKPEPAPNRKP